MKVSPFETIESWATTAMALVFISVGYAGLGYFGYCSYEEWYYVPNPEAFVSVGYIAITAVSMSYWTFKIIFTKKEKVHERKDQSLG